MSANAPAQLAVLGAGRSGYGAACLGRKLGSQVTVLDGGDVEKLAARRESFEKLDCEVVFGPEANAWKETPDLVVVSPGIDLKNSIVRQFSDQGVPVIAEVEFAFQHSDARVVAITGTNGKTTTTEMVTEVLNGNEQTAISVGNYGKAWSEVVAEDTPCDVFVAEVSSFQLEALQTFRPDISVWMNFAPDHLDRYDSVDDYFAAKHHIFDHQQTEDLAVIHAEDVQAIGAVVPRVVTFSAYAEADYGYVHPEVTLAGVSVADMAATPLRGTHNAENLMATLAVCTELGVPVSAVQSALKDYRPPAHRCELIREVDGHEYINDSKATNVHALESALRGLTEKVVLLAGGKDKGLDYTGLKPLLADHVQCAVLIGQTSEGMKQTWESTIPSVCCETLEDAVRQASELALDGQAILFSPGASSFDMFTSYEDRGDSFRSIVQAL